MNLIKQIFSNDNLYFYFFGFVTFLVSLIDDVIIIISTRNDKTTKSNKSIVFYIQEFLYTLVSILIGIGGCYIFNIQQNTTYIIAIAMGLFGSSIIRKLKTNKEKIADLISDKIVDTISDAKPEQPELNNGKE